MRQQLDLYIRTVADHDTAWYRSRWGTARTLDALPLTTRHDFVKTPLSKRRYKDEKSLVKVVHTADGPFLSEWAFADIASEPWGAVSNRPFVYLTDPHSAIEKSMWCYERNTVPLIGEKHPDIAAIAAKKYHVDSLIADSVSIMKLLPYLESRTEKLKSITLVGEAFSTAALLPLRAYATDVRLVLAVPEAGVLGVAALADAPVFTVPEGCLAEQIDGELVFSKLAHLITPILRYAPGIAGALGADGRTFTLATYA